MEIDAARLGRVVAPSPHYAGLPELFEVASRLGLQFPAQTLILALEVADPHTIGGALTPAVQAAVPELARRCLAHLEASLAAAPTA